MLRVLKKIIPTAFTGSSSEVTELTDLRPMPLTTQLAYRRFLRSVFQAPARLTLSGGMLEVLVLDISLKGVLVEAKAGLGTMPTSGARGRLRLTLSVTDFIAMDVAVARVQDVMPGQACQIGLQCTHIDLDSVTHLRQLIERNMQDPALLGRELAVLIGYTPDS